MSKSDRLLGGPEFFSQPALDLNDGMSAQVLLVPIQQLAGTEHLLKMLPFQRWRPGH